MIAMLRIECLYVRQPKEDVSKLQAQRDACRLWAGNTGGKIVREVEEITSPTTAMVDRPAIQDILADLACGFFDLLLISDRSRLIGSRADIAALLLNLEQNRKPLCLADHDYVIPAERISPGVIIAPTIFLVGEKKGDG